MAEFTLVIGNKNYSSWSLRGWLMARIAGIDFEEIVELNGQPTQKVQVIGPDGRPVTAFYPMRQMPDGSWRIDGCYLQAPQPHQA